MQSNQRDKLIDHVHHFLDAQKGNTLLWYVTCFCVGIAIYFSLSFEPRGGYTIAVMGALIVNYMYSRRSMMRSIIALSLLMAGIGFAIAQFHTHRLNTIMLAKDLPPRDVIGTVQSTEPLTHGWRVVLNDLEIEKLSADKTPQTVRITIRQKAYRPALGQRIQLRAKLMAPSAPVIPGSYDFQRHAYFQHIGAYGYSMSDITVLKDGVERAGLFQSLRQSLAIRIDNVLDQPERGVVTALLTGQRKGIQNNITNDLRAAGLAHLLAISGLHVGLVASIIFFAVRFLLAVPSRFALYYPIKKISAAIALLCVVFYTILVGAPPSAQRAMVMTGLVLLAVMTDRTALTLRLVAIAALVVLCLHPVGLLQPGFQMSFSAVIGLVSFYRLTRPAWIQFYRHGMIGRAAGYVLGVTATTVIATISTAPFALFHFQQLSLYGFLGNILAMPIMGFWVMPAGVLSFVLMPFGLDSFALHLMGEGVSAITIVAEWVADMEGALWHVPQMTVFVLTMISIGMLILWCVNGRYRLIGLPILIMGVITAVYSPHPIIMVTKGGDIMAYNPNDHDAPLYLATKGDGFTRELLQQAAGRNDAIVWPINIPIDGGAAQCDDWGCVIKHKNVITALITHPMGIQRACDTANLLITNIPVRGSCRAWEFDRFDLWYGGGHAFYMQDGYVTSRAVADERGDRPWVNAPKRKKWED